VQKYLSGLLIFCLAICSFGCNVSVNESIRIRNGETHNGGFSTVNGSITIGDNCKIQGSCNTVNGRIEVGADTETEGLHTVNGSIDLAENTKADEVKTVNGGVTCDEGVVIKGNIGTVNGDIRLTKTIVKHDIETNNGDITLRDESRVLGDIYIEETNGRNNEHILVIRITGDSVVEGDIIVEDRDRKVEVYLLRGGKVLGDIKGAKIIDEG
jgi:DUF4097 and DUF4098 domain-containing protein YvlB